MNNNYCVYKHTTPSKKVYIGITCMKPEKRWKNGKGYENCTAFARAINKYGWQNIDHQIIKSGLNKDEACKLERKYIALYKSADPGYGYNLTHGGEHYTPNKEWRERLSNSLKKAYKENPQLSKHLSDIQKGKKMTAESSEKKRTAMIAFYAEHPEKRKECGKGVRGKKRTEKFCAELGKRKSKRIKCNENGVIYESLTKASEAIGASRTGITNQLHGRAKTCKGYTFSFI